MDKKDIYEHLAKIYLDASSNKKNKHRIHHGLIRRTLFIGSPVILAAAIFFLISPHKSRLENSELALIIQPETVKINFNFDPAKKEIYTLDLNKLNLARFRAIFFSVRKADLQNKINLKIELTSRFKEKSADYVKNIPYRWQAYKINLSEFKGISRLSDISSIAFIVEEWNTEDKNGVVFIDNIGLLK